MVSNLFEQFHDLPSAVPDPYATGGLRIWDDYQFLRKGVRGAGGPPAVRPPTALAAPVNVVSPVVSGTLRVGQILSCTTGSWTGTAPISYAFQWFRVPVLTDEAGLIVTDDLLVALLTSLTDGAISGATASTYLLQPGDLNEHIYCRVTGTNIVGSSAANSNIVGPILAAVAPATPPVSLTVPVIDDATPTEDSPLHVTDGTWSGTLPMTFIYEWHAVDPEVVDPPVGAGSPFVTGSTTRGSTLHVSTGTWGGTAPFIYTYQWKRLPATLIGSSSSSYTTVPADVGFDITCTVTATNAAGGASQAASNSRGPITEPVPGEELTDEGEALTHEGEELTS